jgi:shikimate kinase
MWLAQTLAVPFVDTDAAVLDALCATSVKQVWATDGEQVWRDAEARVIPPLLKAQGVVALGGGAPMLEEVSAALEEVPMVIHLWGDPDVLYARQHAEDDRPPLTQGDLGFSLHRTLRYRALSTAELDTSSEYEVTQAALLSIVQEASTQSS